MKLIDKYLPSDYNDSVSKRIKPTEPLSPDNIFEEMFCNFPSLWMVGRKHPSRLSSSTTTFLVEYTSSGYGRFTSCLWKAFSEEQ